MKKLLLIPCSVFPYFLCLWMLLGFGLGFFSGDVMDTLGIVCIVLALLSLVCNTVFIVVSRSESAESLLKTALILKIVHIPSYVLIFIIGCIMGLMFFMTFPFILFLVFVDCLTLYFSGMISVLSLAKNLKNQRTLSIIALICQFFFCADIISLFVLRIVSKNKFKEV